MLVVWLLVFSRRASRAASLPLAVGLGLLLGGAAGNLTDRVFRHNHGAVIDFIDPARIGSRDWWPVFNVADAAIVVGVAVLRPRPTVADRPGPTRPTPLIPAWLKAGSFPAHSTVSDSTGPWPC